MASHSCRRASVRCGVKQSQIEGSPTSNKAVKSTIHVASDNLPLCHVKRRKPLFDGPFLTMGWPDAARRFTRLPQRVAGSKFFASRFLVHKSRRRRHHLFVHPERLALDNPTLVAVDLDFADHGEQALDRRRDRVRDMEANGSPVTVDHIIGLAIVQRSLLLAGGLRESLPGPVSFRFINAQCPHQGARPSAILAKS
jgi:hypothetical protein